MDAMTLAKKKVLGDLIRDMQKKMVAMEMPEEVEESSESEGENEEYEDGEMCEGCSKSPCECEKEMPSKGGMTISLAAIKKAPKPMAKAMDEMPSIVEMALMGKEKNKFKKA